MFLTRELFKDRHEDNYIISEVMSCVILFLLYTERTWPSLHRY